MRCGDVVMAGGSPLESFRGTMLNETFPGQDLIRNVYNMYFVDEHRSGVLYSTHVLAISGDLLEHVMWRLLRGSLPIKKPPKVLVVQTGMDDISLPYGCNLEAAEKLGTRSIQMLQYLQSRLPNTYIIYLALFPKGEEWPNRCSQATELANAIVHSYIKMQRAQNEKADKLTRLIFADFSSIFLRVAVPYDSTGGAAAQGQSPDAGVGKYHVKLELMPDTVHPNAAGMELLALELEPLIAEAVLRYNKEFGVTSAPSPAPSPERSGSAPKNRTRIHVQAPAPDQAEAQTRRALATTFYAT
eukprot:jgi/Botrbrau1/19679/Bobra.0003s0041.1